MKTILSFLFMMLFVTSLYSQQMIIDTTGMDPVIKAAILAKQQKDKIANTLETYGEWAGKGKEIGVAVREGLTAVKDVALQISESNLGKTVIFLVVWKVAGIDFTRILVGFIIIAIATIFITKSLFRGYPRRKLVEVSGKWPNRTKKYIMVQNDIWYNRDWAAFVHVAIWLATCGISYAIMFAN